LNNSAALSYICSLRPHSARCAPTVVTAVAQRRSASAPGHVLRFLRGVGSSSGSSSSNGTGEGDVAEALTCLLTTAVDSGPSQPETDALQSPASEELMTRPPTARAQAVHHSTAASITGSSVAAKTTTADTLTGLFGPTDVPDAMTDADATTLTVLGTVTAAAEDKKKVVGAAYAATVLMTATENVHPKTINSSSNAHAPGARTSTHHNTPNDTLHNRGLSNTSTNTSAVAYLSVSNKPRSYLDAGQRLPHRNGRQHELPQRNDHGGHADVPRRAHRRTRHDDRRRRDRVDRPWHRDGRRGGQKKSGRRRLRGHRLDDRHRKLPPENHKQRQQRPRARREHVHAPERVGVRGGDHRAVPSDTTRSGGCSLALGKITRGCVCEHRRVPSDSKKNAGVVTAPSPPRTPARAKILQNTA